MEAKELMIGDWVHAEAHRGFNAQNVKVETIPDNDCDNKYGHHYGHIGTWLDGGDNDFRDVEAKHLQPIPITPKILEKNGFTDVINPPYKERVLHHVIDGYCVKINVVNKDANMIITPLAERTLVRRRADFILPNPDYVHELQHAMRICGILKEIEL